MLFPSWGRSMDDSIRAAIDGVARLRFSAFPSPMLSIPAGPQFVSQCLRVECTGRISKARYGTRRYLRLHRNVLQFPAPTFDAWTSQSNGVRTNSCALSVVSEEPGEFQFEARLLSYPELTLGEI